MIEYNEEYDNEIKEIIKLNPKNYIKMIMSKGFKNRYKNRSYLIDYINSVTPLLNDTFYSLKTKLFWVLNRIQDFPRCKGCGKKLEHYNIKKLVMWQSLGYGGVASERRSRPLTAESKCIMGYLI